METLLGVLIATAPLAGIGALLKLANLRERGRLAAAARQIALTEAIHARLGAVVAPEVRRRWGRWHVTIAAPLDRPSVVASVLSIVEDVFAHPETAPFEIVLRPQPMPGRRGSGRQRAPLGQESLSWT